VSTREHHVMHVASALIVGLGAEDPAIAPQQTNLWSLKVKESKADSVQRTGGRLLHTVIHLLRCWCRRFLRLNYWKPKPNRACLIFSSRFRSRNSLVAFALPATYGYVESWPLENCTESSNPLLSASKSVTPEK